MRKERVVYQNWIVELGFDPRLRRNHGNASEPLTFVSGEGAGGPEEGIRERRIRETVAASLARLSADERELIERLHYMGQTYAEIADLSGRAVHKLEALHGRAFRKLKRLLAPLVREMYGLSPVDTAQCPICNSPHRREMDRLIRARDRHLTWRPIIRRLRREFGLEITAPQILIGHEKYH